MKKPKTTAFQFEIIMSTKLSTFTISTTLAAETERQARICALVEASRKGRVLQISLHGKGASK